MKPAFRISRGRLRAPLLAAALAAVAAAAAAQPMLSLPVDCALGESCYIQQYVDRAPGPEVRDIGCGTLANDGHDGTDFAVPSTAAMAAGVPVVAAAAGTVAATRDGMPDIAPGTPGAPDIAGQECGNGVRLSHGAGWETLYCHLRQGSVAVREGDRIAAGTPLGLVGQSGEASFPHVHFAVMQNGAPVDPFRPDDSAACGAGGSAPLWRAPPDYRPGGVIAAGLAETVPDYEAVKAGLPQDGLEPPVAALVGWAYLFAGRAGDRVDIALAGPDGPIAAETLTLDRDQPLLYRAWGLRAPPEGFGPGPFTARIAHRRGAALLDRRTVTAE